MKDKLKELDNWQRHYSISPPAMEALQNILVDVRDAVIIAHIDRLHADSGRVDEAVERAASAFMRVRGLGMANPWENMLEESRESYRPAFRAAVKAALAAQGQGEAVACPHHVRYPHPCRECEDGPVPEDFRSYPAHAGDKCFACGRAIGRLEQEHLVDTRDAQQVYVGSECYKIIKASGTEGWQPPKGGPRLWLIPPASPAGVPDGWASAVSDALAVIKDAAQFHGELPVGMYRHIQPRLTALLAAAPSAPDTIDGPASKR